MSKNGILFDSNKPNDFVAVGRLCIDLNANEINRPMEDTVTFTKYVGGSPANICIGMARLGLKTAFVGKVADDQMGRFIVRYLEQNGIDTRNVVKDDSGAVTGLAFTEIKSPTDCSILMYRDNVADLKLTAGEVDEALIASSKMVLISGTALAQSPSREAVFQALRYARKHGAVIAFDLDYRPYTWTSDEETAVYYNQAAEYCDIIIGTREEFDMMERLDQQAERSDLATASAWFNHRAQIVIIKHGKEGSIAYGKDGASYRAKSYKAQVVKTFGAGDSYAAGFLYSLMQGAPVADSMAFGSAAAAIVVSSHSCSDAMPSLTQVRELMAEQDGTN